MGTPGKLDRFDPFLKERVPVNPWQKDGSFRPDHEFLETLLSVAVGTAQRSGIVAGAVDVWVADELRRAGFDQNEVWPRKEIPRVMPRDVHNFVQSGLTKTLREQVENRFASAGARRALPAEAHVMGSAYTKQGDVVIASWAAGVELLVSTKTMLSSYSKNLRNRFEEGYGDAKNLRGRHPLAALGFVFVVGSDIPSDSRNFAIDMLRKLTTEPNVYDCACLLVVDGIHNAMDDADEEDVEARGTDDEPTSLLNLSSSPLDDTDTGNEEAETACTADYPASGSVRLVRDDVPPEVDAEQFFVRLIGKALDQMPLATYPAVRERRAEALRTNDV